MTWKDPQVKGADGLIPQPFRKGHILSTEEAEYYAPYLVNGALWIARTDLVIDVNPADFDRSYASHELQYLIRPRYVVAADKATVKRNSMSVYTGQVRVEEGAVGDVRRISRHTFLIDMIRYMTAWLPDFEPVT